MQGLIVGVSAESDSAGSDPKSANSADSRRAPATVPVSICCPVSSNIRPKTLCESAARLERRWAWVKPTRFQSPEDFASTFWIRTTPLPDSQGRPRRFRGYWFRVGDRGNTSAIFWLTLVCAVSIMGRQP